MVSAVALIREISGHYSIQRRDAALADIYSNGVISCSQFDSYFKNYEFLLGTCANAAELLLNGPPSQLQQYDFHTYNNIRNGITQVEDFTYSPTYERDVSFKDIIYLLPPGIEKPNDKLLKTMKQLYPLRKTLYNAVLGSLKPLLPAVSTPQELELAARNDTLPPLMVAYIGSREGMTVGFPFELDYTRDYDPRRRNWYENARKEPDRVVWSMPYVDIGASQNRVLTCSKAVCNDNGEVIAVAAADISWEYLLKLLESTGNNGRYVENKFLVDEQGNIVADSTRKLNPEKQENSLKFQPFQPSRLFSSMWRRKNGWIFVKRKHNYLYFFMEIKTLKWLYVEKINFDEFIKSQ